METLSKDAAVKLVRKNLEELDPNGSAMYGETEVGSADVYGDNQSLDSIIARNLPEAINAVHKAAPVQLLEGEAYPFHTGTGDAPAGESISYGANSASDDYCVLHFTLKTASTYLRLVAFQATDSPIVVTDAIGEASPEGRKQLNKYIRGRADRPRLVLLQGKHTGPSFNYYSLKPETVAASPAPSAQSLVGQLSIINEQFYKEPTQLVPNPTYEISRRLRQNIIDYLTAMVMETYSDQHAQVYYQKASTYPSI